MELIAEKKLIEEIEKNSQLLEKTKNTEEKIVLISYIEGLYESIRNMTDHNIESRENTLNTNQKDLKKYVKKIKIYNDKWIRDFTIFKNFHFKYTSQLIIHTEKLLWDTKKEIKEEKRPCIQEMYFQKEEFYHILLEFMKSLNLEDFYKNMIENKNIYPINNIRKTTARAYTLHNPITKQNNIFIKNFEYNISSMMRLVHELGHAYYFEKMKFTPKEYLKYTNSYYKETTSKLFEKLYLDFMINNSIRKEACKIQNLDCLENNLAFLSFSFAYSLLDDEFLWGFRDDEKYKRKQESRLSQFIQDKAFIKKTVYDFDKLDVRDNYIYMYGDIISMFLKNDVDKEGLQGKKIEDFLLASKRNFNTKYLQKNSMTPNHYLKLYKEQLKHLKKIIVYF